MKVWQGIKVRAVCDDIGIDDRISRLFVQIHNLTNKGKKGIEVFELRARESVESKLGLFKHYSGEGYVEQQIDDLRKMFSDPQYRKDMYQNYMDNVQPRVSNYGLKDVLRALKG